MSKIAIISKNMELIRFIELELSFYGLELDVLDQVPGTADEYAFCMVDTDTVGISSSKKQDVEILRVCSPANLFEIRSMCMKLSGFTDPSLARTSNNSNLVYVEDEKSGEIRLHNIKIKLTRAEFDVLLALCEARGQAVSREALMDMLGAQHGNIADVYVCSLRKKLETATSQKVIITERALGYKTVLKLIK